ncbi:lasso RiPP family leader peptide-containing protein [Micromonospora wenchangensis]|uniref:lasso RiPP family leader peptide-containing protein n=1 Tax=Micromonospora wenchangensis TaxID=1185415 RepID=UPI00380B8540
MEDAVSPRGTRHDDKEGVPEMNEELLEYEPPAISEVGDFAELTRITCCGRWVDNIWVSAWFDL